MCMKSGFIELQHEEEAFISGGGSTSVKIPQCKMM